MSERDPDFSNLPPSTLSILGDVAGGIGRIIRGEIALVRADAARSAAQVARALAMLAVAAITAMVALNALAGSATLGLVAAGLPAPAAALIVGIVLLAVALFFLNRGLVRLKPRNLALSASADSIKSDLQLFVKTEKSDG
ncbi:MAG: phage holin family protein [Paracoccaceae bacterium]